MSKTMTLDAIMHDQYAVGMPPLAVRFFGPDPLFKIWPVTVIMDMVLEPISPLPLLVSNIECAQKKIAEVMHLPLHPEDQPSTLESQL